MVQGEKITVVDGVMHTPDFPIIPFIEGDGIGPEIWQVAQRVFDEAVTKVYNGQRAIVWKEVLAGEKAFNQTGEWLPSDTFAAIREYLIAIKGPLTTPVGGGIRSLNVTLRQELDLYVCLRPVRHFDEVPSPLKRPEDTDMVIFRENTEDIYAGIEFKAGTPEAEKLIKILQDEFGVKNIRFPETSGIGIKPVSEEGTKRLVRAAIQYAIDEGRKSVTLVHKGNIMKFTEGAFKQWGYDLAEEEFGEATFTWQTYDRVKADQGAEAAEKAMKDALQSGKVIIKDCIADIFLEEIIARPKDHDVVATLNLNGDYISDALAAQVGGVGIAPGANINYVTGHAIFEATHGTAPKFAGLNKVNPSSVILSGTMMLEHIGWKEAADVITAALEQTIANKTVTFDFANLMTGADEVSCSAFGELVIQNMK